MYKRQTDAAAGADATSLAGLDPLLQRLCSDATVASALRAMRVGCRVRLTTADATKHSAARDAWVQLSDDGTTVRWGWGAASIRLELLDALRWAMPGADSSPTAAPTDADARALAGGGDVTPRGSPRRSRTRDWHASLNALGEGAEYSEPEPSPVHRASDVSRSSTVAFESSRPSSAGRYSSKSSTGRYSELSRPSRATELATSGGWETPRPSCSPVLVEEEGPAAADTRGLDERLNESLPPPSQLRRSLSQEVASRPRSRSSIAAAAEELSLIHI